MPLIGGSYKVPRQINYSKIDSMSPVYWYQNVPFFSGQGQSAFNILTDGTKVTTVWQMPLKQGNTGMSYIDYTIDYGTASANKYLAIYQDINGEFDRVRYGDSSNLNIVDVQNQYREHKVLNRLYTCPEDLRYMDNAVLDDIYQTNEPLSNIANVNADGTYNSVPFVAPQELFINPIVAAKYAAPQKKKVYLSTLAKKQFFGQKQDLILPVDHYFTLDWRGDKLGFQCGSATDPTNAVAVLANQHAVAGLTFKYAVQMNEVLLKQMKDEISKAGGFKIALPWTFNVAITSQGATNQIRTFGYQIQRAKVGLKMQKIIYFSSKTNPAANEQYFQDNTNGAVIGQYHTELDGGKLQNNDLMVSSTQFDDWVLHKDRLKDTMYYRLADYRKRWVHVESFDYNQKMEAEEVKEGYTMVDGLPVEKPIQYQVVIAAPSGALAYTPMDNLIIQGLKELTVTPEGFSVVPGGTAN